MTNCNVTGQDGRPGKLPRRYLLEQMGLSTGETHGRFRACGQGKVLQAVLATKWHKPDQRVEQNVSTGTHPGAQEQGWRSEPRTLNCVIHAVSASDPSRLDS